MPRVVVTGLGAIAPVGDTVQACFDNAVAGRSGIRLLVEGTVPGATHFVAGQVALDVTRHWPPHVAAQYDRATQFALIAARQAVDDAALVLTDEASLRAGVYWGTGLGGATSIEESYRQLYAGNGRVRPSTVVLGMSNGAAGQISIAHGLRGPSLNLSTACSSSAASIGEACRAIRAGHADVIVAGGSEALITRGNILAWDAMRALAHADPSDPSRSCKPFALDRTGIVLGEGAAALVLEAEPRARARGARVYAEVAGYGNASDAMGMSRPDADGQTRAMRIALADAELTAAEIGYVNAHGTATPIGDVVETASIRATFGEHARTLLVSSTKAVHGHMMGATGALEFLLSILALRNAVAPPTAHLDHPDPECDLDFVPGEARPFVSDAVLSNSFGFGGMNAVLIARRAR